MVSEEDKPGCSLKRQLINAWSLEALWGTHRPCVRNEWHIGDIIVITGRFSDNSDKWFIFLFLFLHIRHYNTYVSYWSRMGFIHGSRSVKIFSGVHWLRFMAPEKPNKFTCLFKRGNSHISFNSKAKFRLGRLFYRPRNSSPFPSVSSGSIMPANNYYCPFNQNLLPRL